MKIALEKINELVQLGIIKKYAIAGGMAQLYYIKPTVTFDLDLIITLANERLNPLDPLAEIYEWAKSNGFETPKEFIMIGGVPVQFIIAYDDLVLEALENSKSVQLFNVETHILTAEYLMAILIKTGRAKDFVRLGLFLDNPGVFSQAEFSNIIKKYNLLDKYEEFKRRQKLS